LNKGSYSIELVEYLEHIRVLYEKKYNSELIDAEDFRFLDDLTLKQAVVLCMLFSVENREMILEDDD